MDNLSTSNLMEIEIMSDTLDLPNRNSPASPVSVNYHDGSKQTFLGLSKREVFAMNAPECPVWFRIQFKNSKFDFEIHEPGEELLMIEGKIRLNNVRLSEKGELELIREWSYAYADTMLADKEQSK